MNKRIAFTVCVMLLCFCAIHPVVYANAPAPPSYFYGTVENASNDVAYVDVLIKIEPQSEGYTEFNTDNGRRNGISENSEIANYNQDGYMSLSFHYNAVSSDMGLDFLYYVMEQSNQSIDKITATVKIALVGKDGSILNVSAAADTTPPDADSFARSFSYDMETTELKIVFNQFYKGSSGGAIFMFLILGVIILRMALSVGIETLLALPFMLRPLWKIIAVNTVTQILLIVFMRSTGMMYAHALIIGEVFVYLTETVAYLLMFKSINKWKIIIYTAIANTATLCAGLILNAAHILMW